jgi:hypothetical protein
MRHGAPFLFAVLVSTAAAAAAAGPRLPLPLTANARSVELIPISGSDTAAEVLTLADGLVPGLLATRLEEQVRIAGWPVAPGERADVVLTRRDVYAPGAKIWQVRAEGPREVARSRLVFFWGGDEHDPAVRLMVSVDPLTGELRGTSSTMAGEFSLTADPRRVGGRGGHLLAPDRVISRGGRLAAVDTGWSCGTLNEPTSPGSHTARSAGGPEQEVAAAISSIHTATIAVDTDNELMLDKFGDDTSAANDYLATLFAALNVIYERDLRLRLLQGTTFLRVSAVADPYAQPPAGNGTVTSAQLNELAGVWQTTHTTVTRALVMMLSGKSPDDFLASGRASVSPTPLCSTTNGYSFTQIFKFGANPEGTVSDDDGIVAHELGHNLGARHTHCELPPVFIDHCYNIEAGCFSGVSECPVPSTIGGIGGVTGTLMSYCHFGQNDSGQGGPPPSPACNSSDVFHPGSVGVIDPIVESRVGQCVLPLFNVTGISPNHGSVDGGTTVTIAGEAFDPTAVVHFDGFLASNIDVVDASTITADSPAHATGTVSVTVTNPGSLVDNVPFFYVPNPTEADFFTVDPCRVVDTRNVGGVIPAGGTRTIQVTGACGVPDDAGVLAVSANVTVTGATAGGFLSFYPDNAFFLGTSTINFAAGQTRANNAALALSTDGTGRVEVVNGSGGSAHVILDVNGYYLEVP